MTDGYVGNEEQILAEIRRHPNARIFSFWIGSSVNRYLLDNMARQGRGEVEYVSLSDDGSAAARRFHERVRNPLLTDIALDWGGLPVADVNPQRVPDLFSAKPVAVFGRYTGSGRGVLRLSGKIAGRPFAHAIPIELPASEPRHEALGALWARTRIAELMSTGQEANREAITKLGLDHRLMTPFTSFVAVEEVTVTEGGRPRRMEVPVEMPEGVSYEGIFGKDERNYAAEPMRLAVAPIAAAPPAAREVWRSPEPGKIHPQAARFVRDGKASIMIWLADTSPATLAELKKLGFEMRVQPKSGTVVIGWLPVDKIALLAKLPAVRSVAPYAP
jgi:Ca-activated chloride channel family protein